MKWKDLPEELLHQRYVEEKKSLDEIANEMGVVVTTIRRHLMRQGVKMRHCAEGKYLRHPPATLKCDESTGLTPDWIVGFVDGDGCFSIGLQTNSHNKIGIQVIPSFSVGQKNPAILYSIKEYFGIGSVNIPKNMPKKGEWGPIPHYQVSGVKGCTPLMAFFEERPPKVKKRAFEIWCKIIRYMRERAPLTFEDIEKIKTWREGMNRS